MNVPCISSAALCSLLFLIIGTGEWTLRASSSEQPSEKVLFEENFTNTLGKDWSWLREIPNRWKIDKERKELLISPVWAEGNLKNVLLRTASELKEGPIAIEVHIIHEPRDDYEYSGLIWYFDDKNFVAIRKGPHGDDGKIVSLVRKKDGKGDGPTSAHKNVIYKETSIDLRMVITEAKVQGWYRASSTDKWRPLGEVEMPSSGTAKVGFRTGNGGDNPSWARFSKFRILRLGSN